MKITEGDIKHMVCKVLKRLVQEGISDITYHFCSVQSCLSILHDDVFLLTMSSNKSDAYDNKRLFYLSTQRSRSKELGFANHLRTCARMYLS